MLATKFIFQTWFQKNGNSNNSLAKTIDLAFTDEGFSLFILYLFRCFDVLRRESKCQPVIVVDAPSCYSMWCRGINWTIGLEVQELIYRLRTFVEAFDDMGARLVFFVRGLTPQKKRKTWLRRRIGSIHNMHDVYDLLYANKMYEDIPESLDSIPPNMGNFVAFVLKHVLNCTVSITVFVWILTLLTTEKLLLMFTIIAKVSI